MRFTKNLVSKQPVVAAALFLALLIPLFPTAYAIDAEPLCGQFINEVEPNNSLEAAQEINDDDTVTGVISSRKDLDYYKVVFPRDGIANFWCQGEKYTLEMELYEGDIYTMSGTESTSNRQTYILDYDVEAGVEYYIRLKGSSEICDYNFRVRLQPL